MKLGHIGNESNGKSSSDEKSNYMYNKIKQQFELFE